MIMVCEKVRSDVYNSDSGSGFVYLYRKCVCCTFYGEVKKLYNIFFFYYVTFSLGWNLLMY